MNFLFFFILVIFLHAIYNLINYFRYPIIEKNLLDTYSTDSSEQINAAMHKTQILSYIRYAGVKDRQIPITQSLGYGQIASSNVSVFNNILNPRQDIAINAMQCLLEAKGNYWSRFVNSFNPFYWIRIIIFIPKYLFSYLGLKEESIFIKIFQLIYWLLAAICTFFITVFPEEIKTFILSILNIF